METPHLAFAVGPNFLLSALHPIHQFDAGAHLLAHPAVMHSDNLTQKIKTKKVFFSNGWTKYLWWQKASDPIKRSLVFQKLCRANHLDLELQCVIFGLFYRCTIKVIWFS